jgi:hypothetical protein
MSRLLLCTDLDRTLLPNGPQSESPDARLRFAALAARPEVMLGFVTGRHRELVEQAIANYRLPVPDYVIADVGTTLLRVEDGAWRVDDAWRGRLALDWSGHARDEVRRLLGEFADLRPQPADRQGEFKLSFFLPLYRDADAMLADIERQLAASGLARSTASTSPTASAWSTYCPPRRASGTPSSSSLPSSASPRTRCCSPATAATTSTCSPARSRPCWSPTPTMQSAQPPSRDPGRTGSVTGCTSPAAAC